MSSGGLAGLCLCKSECVEHWRSIMGTKEMLEESQEAQSSIETLFGEKVKSMTSFESEVAASENIDGIFHKLVLDSRFQDSNAQGYLHDCVIPTLMPALAQLYSQQPSDPIMWLADWLTLNNPKEKNILPPDGH